MLRKILVIVVVLWSLHHRSAAQILTLTSSGPKAVKIQKNVLGVKYNNCYVKDDVASYGLVGSVSSVRDQQTKKITSRMLTLGNGGLGNSGKEKLYTIALSLPAIITKGVYTLKTADDNGLVIVPKGTSLEVEYAARLVTVSITNYDEKTVSGELNGTFVLADKAVKGQPVQVIIKGASFANCEIIN